MIAYSPLLNPIRLIQDGHPFNKRFFESMADFEEQETYCQKFETSDTITFQFVTYNPATSRTAVLKPVSGIGTEYTFSINWSAYLGGIYYYQFSKLLDVVVEGFYVIKFIFAVGGGSPTVYYSEPIEIKATHDNTVLIKYAHDQNDYGMRFISSAGLEVSLLQLRVEGGFLQTDFKPGSKDVSFVNQNYDVTLVNSIPFSTQKLTIGNGCGVPNWMADKINRIFSCANVEINSAFYSKLEGAKLEAQRIPLSPLASWSIEVIKKNNEFYDEYVEITRGGDFNSSFNEDFNNNTSEEDL
jgi:hypothetical protein